MSTVLTLEIGLERGLSLLSLRLSCNRFTRRAASIDRVLWIEDATFRELDAMAYDPVGGMTAPTTPG